MTIRLGLAVRQELDRSLEPLLTGADAAPCWAKDGGGNQMVHDQQEAAA